MTGPLAFAAIAVSLPRPCVAIFWGGLFAGVFDIIQAFIGFGLLGAKPYQILQHIAGGIFGARSYETGLRSAALGIVLHFTIAFTAATLYYLASRVTPVLVDHPVLCGLLYGEVVFLFMYFVVLPLSAQGPTQFNIATYIVPDTEQGVHSESSAHEGRWQTRFLGRPCLIFRP